MADPILSGEGIIQGRNWTIAKEGPDIYVTLQKKTAQLSVRTTYLYYFVVILYTCARKNLESKAYRELKVNNYFRHF